MNRFLLTALVVVVLVPAALALAKDGDKNATGALTSVKATQSHVTASGWVKSGWLWLGCTVDYSNGNSKDLSPQKVRSGLIRQKQFNKLISIPLDPEGVKKITVALWRWKVGSAECAKARGGTRCEHCERNGYHMEGRIAVGSDSP